MESPIKENYSDGIRVKRLVQGVLRDIQDMDNSEEEEELREMEEIQLENKKKQENKF